MSGALAIHSLTGLESKVTAVPARPRRSAPSAVAVAHGDTRWRAAALTMGASVVPITSAATTGSKIGRQK